MSIIGWRAWYVGGRVYNSIETPWEDVPDDGMLYWVLYKKELAPDGNPMRYTMSGSDYYFKAGEVYGESNDPPEEILRRYPGAIIKRGKWTTDDELQLVDRLAMAAHEWP